MIMGDFYICLPSNSSMDVYPENNPGHFYTKLPRDIDLSGMEYEVGLSEIIFTNSYVNVEKETLGLRIKPQKDSNPVLLSLHPGLYESTPELLNSLNNLTKSQYGPGKNRIKFYFNKPTKRASLKIYDKGASAELSPGLAKLLHLKTDKWYKGSHKYWGSGPVDIHEDTYTIYAYCDIVEHRPVGDVMAPLLRIIPTIDKTAEVIDLIYENPHYIPLARRHFNSIEIRLATDKGKELVFESGKTVLTLHFRPRRRE